MEKSPESIEHYDEDPSVESLLFDAKMLKSKESFERIKEDSETEEPSFDSLHTKQKLLFAHVLPEAEPSVQSGNYVDLNGLNVGECHYGFDNDCLKYIHEAFVHDAIEGATNEDELETKLDEASAPFLKVMTERAAKETADIRAKFAEKAKAVRAEIMAKYTPLNERAACIQSFAELTSRSPEECEEATELVFSERKRRQGYSSKLYEPINNYAKAYKKFNNRQNEARKKADEERKRFEAALEEWKKTGRGKKPKIEEYKVVPEKVELTSDERKIINNNISVITPFFKEQDAIARNYKTIRLLAERLNLPPDDEAVVTAFDSIRIKKEKYDSNPDLLDIAKQYSEEVAADRERNYEKEVFGDLKQLRELSGEAIRNKFDDRLYEAQIQYYETYLGINKQQAEKLASTNFYRRSFKMRREHILKNSDLTAEELDELGEWINTDPSLIVKPFLANYCSTHPARVNHKYYKGENGYTQKEKIPVQRALMSYYDKILDSEKARLPDDLKAPLATRGKLFDSQMISKARETRQQFASLEEARENAAKELAKLSTQTESGIADTLDDFEAKLRRRIRICTKAYDASVYVLSPNMCTDDLNQFNEELNVIKQEEAVALKGYTEIDAVDKAREDTLSFGRSILGDSITSFYVLPTGFVFHDGEGVLRSITFGANMDQISARLDDKDRSVWNEFLAKRDIDSRQMRQKATKYINRFINEEYHSSLPLVKPEERDVSARLQAIGIKEPDTLSGLSNFFSEQYNEADVTGLEHCFATFGKYIKPENSVASTYSIPIAGTIKANINSFLLGRETNSSIILAKNDNTLSLPIKNYSRLVDTMGEEAADTCIKNDIVITAFNSNSSLLSIVKRILGDRANASQVDILRLTGKNVASPIERSNIAARAYFLSAYMHYLNGEEIEDPKLAELIQRVDNLVYPEETPDSQE